MIFVCIKSGLTQGNKVYKGGNIFKLDEHHMKTVDGKTDAQIAADQRKIYGKEVYRRASQDEIFAAIDADKSVKSLLDEDELKAFCTHMASKEMRKARGWEQVGGIEGEITDPKKAKGKDKE